MRVPTPGTNRQLKVCGAFNPRTGQMLSVVSRRMGAREVVAVLEKLAQRARRQRRLIVVVMDNARIHRAARTCEAIRRLGRWLGIFWLPSYSPDLNDIERVWKREKEHYFSNALPDSFEAFEARVRVRFRSLAHHGSRTIAARSAPIRRIPMIPYNLYEAA